MKHPFHRFIVVVVSGILLSRILTTAATVVRHGDGGIRRMRRNAEKRHVRGNTASDEDGMTKDEDVQFWTRLLQASLSTTAAPIPAPLTPSPSPILPRTLPPIVVEILKPMAPETPSPAVPDTPAPIIATSSPTILSLPEIAPTYGPIVDGAITASPTIDRVCGLSPTERRRQIITALDDANIPNVGITSTSTGSPQSAALDWLVEEDVAELCPEDTNLVQRYVLAVLYYSTNGDDWIECSAPEAFDTTTIESANEGCNLTTTNATVLFPEDIRGTDAWLTPGSECLWGGVSCYGPADSSLEGALSVIEFENNGLGGTFPEEMGFLTNLRFLALERASIVGTLPESIGNLKSLLLLDVDFNSLTGTLPDTLWTLESLRQLDLNDNNFVGTLSEDIALLSKLRFFQIDKNSMTGTIPSSMGAIPKFSFIGLSENYFTGTMPDAVCALRPSPLQTLIVDCTIICAIPNCCTSCVSEGGTDTTTLPSTITPTSGTDINIPATTLEPSVLTPPLFKCPLAANVGCTAPDPLDPVNECPIAGEFSNACNTGEFCCVDGCPRNYCTAKEAV